MSTLKVNTIQDTTGNDALTIDSSGNVTASQGFVPSTQLSHRNLIINGAMQVAQRGTSFTGLSNGSSQYTIDRWNWAEAGTMTATVSITQDSNAPDGFNNSLKLACTTTGSAGYYASVRYHAEAQDLQSLAFGTSNAKVSTLSFWVKSNKTGTGTVFMSQVDASKTTSKQYTISSADTWEHKTITVPANTSNSIADDTGTGIQFEWGFSVDSSYKGTEPTGTWETYSNGIRHYGNNIDIVSSTSDYVSITGVQLEVGSVATPFEHRSYGEELARCQRYYQEFGRTGYMSCRGNGTTAVSDALIPTATVLRASPTITGGTWYATKGSGTTLYNGTGETYSVNSVSSQGVVVDINNIANTTDNMVSVIQVLSVTLDAEL